jgi:hypothetical protein
MYETLTLENNLGGLCLPSRLLYALIERGKTGQEIRSYQAAVPYPPQYLEFILIIYTTYVNLNFTQLGAHRVHLRFTISYDPL